MTNRKRTSLLLALVAIVAAGVVLMAMMRKNADPATRVGADPHAAHATIWTCPMHPEVRERAPGKCPKCGMDLVLEKPIDAATPAAGAETPRAPVQLDTRRRQLLGVRTAPVERAPMERTIRAVGAVRYDETRLADVNLKLDGWIQKLHVNSTGQAIRRGQPLLDLYSPDLLATENEYLLALSTRDTMRQSTLGDAKEQAERLVESARQRLTLWDLPADELKKLDTTRKADATVTFRSPVSGFVIEKPVVSGMRVMPGQTLYKVADLSQVWVEADVFESDAPFVKVGANAHVTVDAAPGKTMSGRAVYVYPFVQENTRTLKVRFAFPNPGVVLKPGMFANVEMHTSLGMGLLVPRDAVLDAGNEEFVFVSEGDGYFQPRQVRAGQQFGDRVQILSGLSEGEQVATQAAFFLDSESQLRAAAGAWDAPAPVTPDQPGQAAATVAFSTRPDPPRSGENEFEVQLTGADGTPIAGAQVQVRLYMPAMPSMNMPAMSSQATLAQVADGVYRGKGMVSMSGRWDVTVTALKDGQRVASKQTALVAK
jgi:RND family efflux transporter MFP subunit